MSRSETFLDEALLHVR